MKDKGRKDSKSKTAGALPIKDLELQDGGAWRLSRRVNWKKSCIEVFQGEPCLKVFYGKGSGTSSDPGVGGMLFSAAPQGLNSQESAMRFEAFFAPGWDWSKGGKLGGFFVGHGDASGYRHSDTASSHRIMWKKDGSAISYIYPSANLPQTDPKLQASGCGIAYFHDKFPPNTLRVGDWNTIVIGLKMNTFSSSKPNADGVAFLEINGVRCSKGDIRWSKSPDLNISSFEFNTFFGGPDPATKDCMAYYRNFQLVPWPL